MTRIRDRVTKSELRRIVDLSGSYAEVVRRMPIRYGSDNHRKIRALIKEYGLDTSHFGTKVRNQKLTEADVFRRNPKCSMSTVKKWAERYLPRKCVGCGNEGEWLGKPLTLQLEHKDGDTSNCERSNLELRCPNCHSQTPTFAGRNNRFKLRQPNLEGAPVLQHRQINPTVLGMYFE